MTLFDERDRNFENKFAYDEELAFKIVARRNKLLGLWAAEKLGKSGDSAESYAREMLLAALDNHGQPMDKLRADFAAAGMTVAPPQLAEEIERLHAEARRQIMTGR